MKTLITIDPGKSTGVAVGTYSDTEPYKLTHAFQIEGGVEGFVRMIQKVETSTFPHEYHLDYLLFDDLRELKFFGPDSELEPTRISFGLGEEVVRNCSSYPDCDDECDRPAYVKTADIIAEKFTARGSGNAFSYRTDALEPLRVEGAMIAMGLDPVWQSPQSMYFMIPSGFKGNKKSLMHKWLKEKGLYVTGKDVGCKNADDARSAIAHAIVYLRNQKHKPTLEKYFRE